MRQIGEIIAPIIANAIGLGRLQEFLDTLTNPSAENRKWWVMEWWESGTISAEEAMLLIQHNQLEDA